MIDYATTLSEACKRLRDGEMNVVCEKTVLPKQTVRRAKSKCAPYFRPREASTARESVKRLVVSTPEAAVNFFTGKKRLIKKKTA